VSGELERDLEGSGIDLILRNSPGIRVGVGTQRTTKKLRRLTLAVTNHMSQWHLSTTPTWTDPGANPWRECT